jgi:dihydropyrimidinase
VTELDLRIDDGLVVRAEGEPRVESIGIRAGKIVATGDLGDARAREVISVAGTHVLPGLIDTHFHIGFTDALREWETETRSAAIGGVTTILVYFRDTGSYEELLPPVLAHANRTANVDFAIHLGMLHDGHLGHLERYIDLFGIRSIKMYTTYKHGELSKFGVVGQDDGFIFDALSKAARLGGITVNVHCENDDMVERGRSHWQRPGITDLQQWSAIRPVIAEVEAVRRVALLAREANATLCVPHLSSSRALDAALEARRAGGDVRIETSPHYLMADRLASAGVLAKVNPPVRTGDDARVLLSAIRDGHIDVVGSDHAANMLRDKQVGDLVRARPGFPGVGALLPVLLDWSARDAYPITAIARLQRNAAQVFGLPTKGEIRVGADADLAVVDTTMSRAASARAFDGISDYSPYEGITLRGWPVMTFVRGALVAHDGALTGVRIGRYVRRAA